jgi:hypothetical protein
MARWQYPQLAELPPAKGTNSWQETILADKWAPNYPDQIFRKQGISSAIQAGSFFENPLPILVPASWESSYPDMITRVKPGLSQSIQSGSVFDVHPTSGGSAWPETIYADKWLGKLPDNPVMPRQGLSSAIQSGSHFFDPLPFASNLFPGAWDNLYPDIITRPKPGLIQSVQAGSSFQDMTVTWPEAIYADKWKPLFPDLILRNKILPVSLLNDAESFVPVLIPQIYASSWYSVEQDILFAKPALIAAIQAGSLFRGDIPRAETITLDKWISTYPDRLFPVKGVPAALFTDPYGGFVWLPPVVIAATRFVSLAFGWHWTQESQLAGVASDWTD